MKYDNVHHQLSHKTLKILLLITPQEECHDLVVSATEIDRSSAPSITTSGATVDRSSAQSINTSGTTAASAKSSTTESPYITPVIFARGMKTTPLAVDELEVPKFGVVQMQGTKL